MNVNLTPELVQLVQEKVQTGRYNSVSEVIREALRMMEESDQLKTLQKEDIRKKISAGLKSLSRGKGIDGDVFLLRWKRNLTRTPEKQKVNQLTMNVSPAHEPLRSLARSVGRPSRNQWLSTT